MNVFVGACAGRRNTTGQYNTFFGHNSGGSTTGSCNVVAGRSAGFNLSTGCNNVLFGNQAGADLGSGSNNVIMGFCAGKNVGTDGGSPGHNFIAGFCAGAGVNGTTLIKDCSAGGDVSCPA